jgi:LacI family transcriptional regulator
VLNRKPNISPEVQKRVNDSIKKLDYRVNLRAKGLVQKSSDIIGVIASDITNPPISQFIEAFASRLHENSLGILLGNSGNDIRKEFEFIDLFVERKARGIIYTGKEITEEHVHKLNDCPIPLLVVSQEHEQLKCPVVVFDNYQASYDVVRLLLEKGHSRIGFISCPIEDKHAGLLRQRGYRNALKDVGIAFEEPLLQYADFTMESGYLAAERILEQAKELPTVIYGATDQIAIGALKCLRDKSFRVPDDIAIFGFDNIPVASKLVPSLSSVNLDHYEMGYFSADMLLKMAETSGVGIKKVIFSHSIILRESCR